MARFLKSNVVVSDISKMKSVKFISNSPEETLCIASKLARGLKNNDCLALLGDFGAGKTTFVKGLALAFGVPKKDYVSSPSFVILKIYNGKKDIYHFDLYRLKDEKDAEAVGLYEFLDSGGISVIEWADKIVDFLPTERLEVRFSVKGPQVREICFKTSSERINKILRKISK